MGTQTQTHVKAEYWPNGSPSALAAEIEVDRDESEDPPGVALTALYYAGKSMAGLYLDREAAIVLARNILNAVTHDA